MAFTPFIEIYTADNINKDWFSDNLIRATLIFSKNLKPDKKFSRTRINIQLGEEERIHTGHSIKLICIKSNINTCLGLSDVEKINIILKIIRDCLITIGKIEGWAIESFEEAYNLSKSENGHFVWYSSYKSNRKRNLKARVNIQLDKNGRVPVLAEFLDVKTQQQFTIPIIDTFLHFIDWQKTFLKPDWLDNEKFGFSLINSQLLIYADVQLKKSVTIILEKTWTREELEGHLRMLTFREFKSDKEYVEWMNR
jgi:hypothetical protein